MMLNIRKRDIPKWDFMAVDCLWNIDTVLPSNDRLILQKLSAQGVHLKTAGDCRRTKY